MTLSDVLRAVRARWILFVVCCIVPVAAAFAVGRSSAPVFTSTAELFVAPANSFGPANSSVGPNRYGDAYEGALLAQQQAPSYASLVTSPAVLRGVIADLHLATTPSQLSNKITAASPTNSVLIDITVRDTSAATARAIANHTAVRFAAMVERLSASGAGKKSPMTLTLVKPALLPTTPASSHTKVDRALGLVVGLAVAFTAVILREKTDPRVRTVQQAQSITGCSLVTTVEGAPGRAWLLAGQAGSDPFAAESSRRLRLRLAPALAARHARSVAVTSLKWGDPGPAVAANLALTLAEGGSTVALVDADARAGQVAAYFGADSSPGVAAVVSGEVPMETAIQRYRENLLILPAGLAQHGERQMSPAQLAELLFRLGGMSDHIVVHTGPVLDNAAAAELSVAAHAVLLVVQKDKARQEDLRLGTEILRGAEADLVGVALAPAHLVPMLSAFRTARSGPAVAAAANGQGHVRTVAPGAAQAQRSAGPETLGPDH